MLSSQHLSLCRLDQSGVNLLLLRKMMRMPKGVSPAPARPPVGLSCSQQQQKLKILSSAGMKSDLFITGLSSPPMSTIPAGYFTQISNTAAGEQRANSLYSTPHGPEAKPIRCSSGRLPVHKSNTPCDTHTHCFTHCLIRGSLCSGSGRNHFYDFYWCFRSRPYLNTF